MSERERDPVRAEQQDTADPVAALTTRLVPTVPVAVDELHVAAVLESWGVTDEAAQDVYNREDVFALAGDVSHRMPVAPRERVDPPPERARARRAVAHGPLYIMPSALYPTVLMTIGPEPMVRGMVFATAFGWIWGMGTSAIAYQLVGQSRAGSAARFLCLSTITGLLLAFGGAALLARAWGDAGGVVAFVCAQMAFQLSSMVLVFYRKELLLALLAAPAVAAGIVHVMSGLVPSRAVPTLAVGVASAVVLLVAAWWTALRAASVPDVGRTPSWRRVLVGGMPSACYAGLCALFMLFTGAHYVTGQLDMAIAVAPLVAGMGVVEWRALRFTERSREFLEQSTDVTWFMRAAWRLLLTELTMCLLVLGALGMFLLVALRSHQLLTLEGALLVDAYLLLGGALFLGFVLARHGQFVSLLVITFGVVAANVVLSSSTASMLGPHGMIPIFLLCCVALLVLLLVPLRVSIGSVYNHR
jgi:hypothetical protein